MCTLRGDFKVYLILKSSDVATFRALNARDSAPTWLCFRFTAPCLNMKTFIRAANKGSNSPTAVRRGLKGAISGQRHFEPESESEIHR